MEKWPRPRDVCPLAVNIHLLMMYIPPTSSFIWIGSCTPESDFDREAREDLLPVTLDDQAVYFLSRAMPIEAVIHNKTCAVWKSMQIN